MEQVIDRAATSKDQAGVRSLYNKLIECWNASDSDGFATLFASDGSIVGFDGTQVNGRTEIQKHLAQIFADHRTASYVTIVREIRFLSPDIALLRAVVGMIPPGQKQINPATNAIQSLVAVKEGEQLNIALFQNTPAAFHGRKDDAEQLTNELQKKFDSNSD